MADVNVKVKIDNAEASKSLRELNKSLKELVSAQEQVAAGVDQVLGYPFTFKIFISTRWFVFRPSADVFGTSGRRFPYPL